MRSRNQRPTMAARVAPAVAWSPTSAPVRLVHKVQKADKVRKVLTAPMAPIGPTAHRDWHRGDRLPPDYRRSQYVVDDWRARDLQPPPSGYQWVQIDGDFVLAASATGVISSIVLAPHR
jgi:Ni/Co efflux regulator RcnB